MIITREEWGARAPTRSPKVATKERNGLLLHWNGPPMRIDPDKPCGCAARMRSVQRWHMDNNNWSDFAYSYGVCPHGNIYEGRGLYWDEFATSGSQNGHKWYTVFCMLGADHGVGKRYLINGRDWQLANVEQPTDDMYEALEDLRAFLVKQSFASLRVAPHNEFKIKSCPGPDLTVWADQHNNKLVQWPPAIDDTMEDNMQYIIRSTQGPAFWADNGAPVGQDFGFWKDVASVSVVTVPHEVWQRRLAGYNTHKHVAGDIANAVLSGLDLRDVDEKAISDAVVAGIRKVWSSS